MITTDDQAVDKTSGHAAVAQAVSKNAAQASTDDVRKINSRFGEIEVNINNSISFAHGILGIPGSISFCITDLPGHDTDQFKLLQCLEDDALSFIVVPSQYDNQLLEPNDLDEACRILSIKPEMLVIFFIVSVHIENNERHLSVNAKAPILVNAENKTGTQYVFQNINYKIQHMIS